MARLSTAGPTSSPSMVRRTGNSVDQNMPLRKAPSATCQIRIRPVSARIMRIPEASASTARLSTSSLTAVVAVGERARRNAEQEHRRHAHQRQDRDQQGRAGPLQDEQADRQQLQPAERAAQHAAQPEPDEARIVEKLAQSRARRAQASVVDLDREAKHEKAPGLAVGIEVQAFVDPALERLIHDEVERQEVVEREALHRPRSRRGNSP